jgi:tRNA(His) guanylyltransferase
MKKDNLGDRMKKYESQTTKTELINLIPVVARLDGKSFSKFTKGLRRPYDERLSRLMINTTKFLVKEFNANIGYTQSDEISLVFYNPDPKSQPLFGNRVFKIETTLAAFASVYFNKYLSEYLPEKADKFPTFDCRVFNVPNEEEAVNALYWRELDATKNSITMAASAYYSHKQLMNKNGKVKQEMLFQKGVNWNDYPAFFKRGQYVQRKRVYRKYTTDEISVLPKKHEARINPDLKIERWEIQELDLPPLNKIENKVDVILFGKNYIKGEN